jgi:hypothetical protein
MTAFDEYMQLLKTAASGERPHTMLPGRTDKSKKGSQGTVTTQTTRETTKTTKAEDEPVVTPQVVTTTTPAGAPKVDINFSVKVGSDQTDPAGHNTRARVDSSFMPSGQVGGSFGDEPLLEEGNLMRTTALPGGANSGAETVGDIRTASELQQVLAKAAVTKPSEVVPVEGSFDEEKRLQQLLQAVRQEGLLAPTPVKVGSFNLLRKLSMAGMEEPPMEEPPMVDSPVAEQEEQKAQDSQRKQDLHEQQLQFNQDKHELEMEMMRQDMQQEQETHQLKQQLEQEKLLEKRQGAGSEQGMMPDPAQQQAQQQMQYQQNIMAKAAAIYTDELEPTGPSSALPSMAVGAGLGGAGAHFIAPTEMARNYRDLAAKITPEQSQAYYEAVKRYGKDIPVDIRQKLMEPISDITQQGNRVRFSAPAPVRKRYFLNRALQSNAKRLVQGTGLGLLAGLVSHHAMKE